MSIDDQGLLSEPPLPVALRRTRDRSTSRLDEKLGRLTCQSPSPSPSPAASPMDVDDLLSEILLRLAPLPSSLPRASLVCTHWRRLVTDPTFLRRFRAHHWKPLGVFFRKGLSFSFFLGPRDSASPERFFVRVPRECHEGGGGGCRADCVWEILDCRYGRVVLVCCGTGQILVWNPVTGEDHLLGISQFFLDADQMQYWLRMKAAVISASGNNGPFKLALAWDDRRSNNAHVCVYSSETGVWGNVASAAIQPLFSVGNGNVMVGNTLYWILFGTGNRVCILEFDLDSQDLSVIEVPRAYKNHRGIYLCTLAKGGGISLMVMSENLRGQLWVWEKTTEDSDGVFQWMLGGTIEPDMLLSLRPEGQVHESVLWLEGDDNVMFVSTYKGVFMVHLQSMHFEKIFETGPVGIWYIVPFKYPHAPGDILHPGGVGCGGVQGSGQGHGEDGADRWVPHASTKEGGAHGLKRGDDAHVSWEGRGLTW